MNPQEAYYFEEREAREKALEQKMKGKKVVKEWLVQDNNNCWYIPDKLYTDKEVKRKYHSFQYQPTGREFIVEVDDDTSRI